MSPTPEEPGWRVLALAVDRPVGVLMAALAVVVFGWVSLQQLPVALLPDVSHPTLTVRVEYDGAAPEEVEHDVLIPIEELAGTAEGVVRIESVARAGGGDVVLRFRWRTNLDLATQRVRERLALVQLPDEVRTPRVLRYDPALDPVVRVAVAGELAPSALRTIAVEQIERRLERLDGVAAVRVLGGADEIVRVAVDGPAAARLGLRTQDIARRIGAENVNVAGGVLEDGDTDYLVRTLSELRTLDELRAMPITAEGDRVVRLGDIARIERASREIVERTTALGRPSVEIAIYKEADANLVRVADLVRLALLGPDGDSRTGDAPTPAPVEGSAGATAPRPMTGPVPLSDELPDGVELIVLSDQSRFVRGAIAEVNSTAVWGGLLAVAVLLLFLRSPYATVVIAAAIPLSIVATFAVLRVAEVSLNVMSLGGLALGVGMLVDNSVVVLEAITRRREAGDTPRKAAIAGATEVALAVIASTATTVAVFAPIAFVEGIAGELFGDLAWTVVISLLASLVVALLFVPMLTALPGRMHLAALRPAEGVRARLAPRAPASALADLRALVAGAREGGAGRRALLVLIGPFLLVWVALRTAVVLPIEVLARASGELARAVVVLVVATVLPVVRLSWRALDGVLAGFGWLLRGVESGYRRALPSVLAARVFLAVLLAAGVTYVWVGGGRLGVQLLPDMHQGELVVVLRMPVGTGLDETAGAVDRLERWLRQRPDVVSTSTFVGRRADDLDASAQGEHYGEVALRLAVPHGDPAAAEEVVAHALREWLAGQAGVTHELTRPTLFTSEPSVRIEVRGHDLEALRGTTLAVLAAARTVPGLVEPVASVGLGYPEVRVAFDRTRLVLLGLSVREVAEELRAQVLGDEASSLRTDGVSVPIDVALDRAGVDTLGSLGGLTVGSVVVGGLAGDLPASVAVPGSGGGATAPVSLGQVAELRVATGPAEIRRIDGQRAGVVAGGSELLDLGRLASQLRVALGEVEPASGQAIVVSGQAENAAEVRTSMLWALLLAVFLVYVVMAMTFESFVGPLVVLCTVPLSFTGVVWVLGWTATPLSVVVFIGAIVLVGIVVNNAIVLIEAIGQRRDAGVPLEEAIVEACVTRLRPVLITATTTILGLLPMVFAQGEGAEIRAPLGLVVCVGLATGTLLTLVVIPALYRMVERPDVGSPG